MKIFTKIVLLFLLLPIMAQAELGTEYELSTDDRENIAVLNTLGAVNIIGLSGYYSVGMDIECFKIISIPDPSQGILYLGDGDTEVEVGQILSIDEANGLKFDPNSDFVGDAKFQYASINSNEEVDPNPAIVTIPVYGKNTDLNETTTSTNTNGTTTSTSTGTNGTTASTSTGTNGTTTSTSTGTNGTTTSTSTGTNGTTASTSTDTNGTTASTSTDTNGTTASTSTDTNGTTTSTSTDVNGTSVTFSESCKEYNSTPSLSLWGIIIMIILILAISREEFNQDF